MSLKPFEDGYNGSVPDSSNPGTIFPLHVPESDRQLLSGCVLDQEELGLVEWALGNFSVLPNGTVFRTTDLSNLRHEVPDAWQNYLTKLEKFLAVDSQNIELSTSLAYNGLIALSIHRFLHVLKAAGDAGVEQVVGWRGLGGRMILVPVKRRVQWRQWFPDRGTESLGGGGGGTEFEELKPDPDPKLDTGM